MQPPTTMKRVLLLWCLLPVLMGSPALAQQRTLTIEAGRVYLNGKPVAPEDLPPSLDTRDMNVSFSFSGDAGTFLELGGTYYLLDDTGLHEADPAQAADDDLAVYFRRPGGNSFSVTGPARVLPDAGDAYRAYFFVDEDGRGQALQRYLEELDSRARALRDLSARLNAGPGGEAVDLLFRAREEAAEAARVAVALPRIEVQSYLHDVREHNEPLFEQLLREQGLEAETHRLAGRIRALDDGAERSRLVSQLRAMLEKNFELKQMNRRSEIEQLQGQLEDLQRRLAEREAMRERIIDHRLRELLDGSTRRR